MTKGSVVEVLIYLNLMSCLMQNGVRKKTGWVAAYVEKVICRFYTMQKHVSIYLCLLLLIPPK